MHSLLRPTISATKALGFAPEWQDAHELFVELFCSTDNGEEFEKGSDVGVVDGRVNVFTSELLTAMSMLTKRASPLYPHVRQQAPAFAARGSQIRVVARNQGPSGA